MLSFFRRLSRPKRIITGAIGLFVAAQAIQPDRTGTPGDPSADVMRIAETDPAIARTLRAACYDCHSQETTYPWYAYVTPVNFWLQHHVNEGREELDLGAWGAKTAKWRNHKKKEALEMLKEGEMPLPSYTWLHSEARLTEQQRDSLIHFFERL